MKKFKEMKQKKKEIQSLFKDQVTDKTNTEEILTYLNN